ncbi:hypothetical protein P700755_001223 [Psychroflexus torquis ATCC 700755]|uniref:Uncharacterized protein n=1 Tax=Psychroflexus torquis (strain ATCC 700755 / CIP 106069 / ACAM 623) TaxID=313595 RepID=K4IRR3_PSYTT|nr:hypothetical protein P700755_001223 [Psychroflexus torquis ATCC 700755]
MFSLNLLDQLVKKMARLNDGLNLNSFKNIGLIEVRKPFKKKFGELTIVLNFILAQNR